MSNQPLPSDSNAAGTSATTADALATTTNTSAVTTTAASSYVAQYRVRATLFILSFALGLMFANASFTPIDGSPQGTHRLSSHLAFVPSSPTTSSPHDHHDEEVVVPTQQQQQQQHKEGTEADVHAASTVPTPNQEVEEGTQRPVTTSSLLVPDGMPSTSDSLVIARTAPLLPATVSPPGSGNAAASEVIVGSNVPAASSTTQPSDALLANGTLTTTTTEPKTTSFPPIPPSTPAATVGAVPRPSASAAGDCQNVRWIEHGAVDAFYDASLPQCSDQSTVHLYEHAYGRHLARWRHLRFGDTVPPLLSPTTTFRRTRRHITDVPTATPLVSVLPTTTTTSPRDSDSIEQGTTSTNKKKKKPRQEKQQEEDDGGNTGGGGTAKEDDEQKPEKPAKKNIIAKKSKSKQSEGDDAEGDEEAHTEEKKRKLKKRGGPKNSKKKPIGSTRMGLEDRRAVIHTGNTTSNGTASEEEHQQQRLYVNSYHNGTRMTSSVDLLSPQQRRNAAATSITAPNAVKIFEIGLGCSVKCAASGFLQLRHFFQGQLHYVSMDNEMDLCARGWATSGILPVEAGWLEHFTCRGDQSNASSIQACMDRYGPFDVIIDDGSHFSTHMVTNFEWLFPRDRYLKLGGLYVIEDLSTQFKHRWTSWDEKEQREKWQYPNGHQLVQDAYSMKLCAKHSLKRSPLTTVTAPPQTSPLLPSAAAGRISDDIPQNEFSSSVTLAPPLATIAPTSNITSTSVSGTQQPQDPSIRAPPEVVVEMPMGLPPEVEPALQATRLQQARRHCPYLRFPYHGWGPIWEKLADVACDNEICIFQKRV